MIPVADAVRRRLERVGLIELIVSNALKPDRRELAPAAKLPQAVDLVRRPRRYFDDGTHGEKVAHDDDVSVRFSDADSGQSANECRQNLQVVAGRGLNAATREEQPVAAQRFQAGRDALLGHEKILAEPGHAARSRRR